MKGVKLERDFQRGLIAEIKERLPGCLVMKTDPNYIQGIPDLLVLFGERWAMLEVKKSENAPHQPNQDYYVDLVNSQGGFARFIYPENEDTVLKEMIEEVFYDLV